MSPMYNHRAANYDRLVSDEGSAMRDQRTRSMASARLGDHLVTRPLAIASLVVLAALLIAPAAFGADAYEPDDARVNVPLVQPDGSTISRALDTYGDVDWVAVEVKAGVTYAIETAPTSADLWVDGYAELYERGSNTLLAASDDDGMNLMPGFVRTADKDTVWEIKVRGRTEWVLGAYTLTVREIDPARIEGKVTGVAGLGQPEARVVLYRVEGSRWSPVAETVTDLNGRYGVVAQPGTYRIGFAAQSTAEPTRFFEGATAVTSASDLVLSAGETRTMSNASVVDWTRVNGEVTADDGTTPLGSVSVTAYELRYGRWEPFCYTSTTATGAWTMYLARGTYRFGYVDRSGTYPQVFHPAANTVDTASDVTLSTATATLSDSMRPAADLVQVTPDAAAGTPVAAHSLQIVTLAGTNRFDTAAKIARDAYPNGADAIVVVTATAWADGLGAAALAGALDAPILLVNGTTVPAVTAAEARRLAPKRAVIVGGTSVVGAATQKFLAELVGAANVTRIGGANRYETARLVADATLAELAADGRSWSGHYILASGLTFPDVLAASPLAAGECWPVLLTAPDALTIDVAHFLASHPGAEGLVVGGPGAVSEAVVDAAAETSGGGVVRVWGTDRYATALAVADYAADNGYLDYSRLAIATGEDFPDALACSVRQAKVGSVLLLTPSGALDSRVADTLGSIPAGPHEIAFVGGTAAISTTARQQVTAQMAR
jgi:putative cell wall-binding protein